MATNIWQGDVDEDASNASNWSEGIPVANQDIIIPPWATYGITSNLTAITSIALKSFWVQEGFSKNIGTSTGFFRVDISGSGATRFLYEGSSTLAKFHFIKTLASVAIDIRKTGVGNAGQPAFQMMTNDVNSAAGTYMGTVSVYSGEVSLGPENTLCEVAGLVVGSNSDEASPVVDVGVLCRDDTSDGSLLNLWMNSGTVNLGTLATNVHLHGGVINHTGTQISILNLWGGVIKLNNPTGTGGGNTISNLNLRGGTLDNSENPSPKTITNANLYSGSIQDPVAKLVYSNPVVYKGVQPDVEFDWGPDRTITIA